MTTSGRLNTLVMVAFLSIVFGSCGGNGPDDAPAGAPVLIPNEGVYVTVGQAESLMPFQVRLPSYIPEGVLPEPQLAVVADKDGEATELVAVYLEDTSSPEGASRLVMRFTEVSGSYGLLDNVDHEVVEIRGVPVHFSIPYWEDFAGLNAVWSQAGTGVNAEFAWLSSDKGERVVTEEMRAEAIKVIDSMIK